MTQPADDAADLSATDSSQPTDAPAESAAEGVDAPGTADEPEPSPNSEAARWRTKLREAEAQRDALAERIAGYQRRECEAGIADLLDVPADLFEVGLADVADFYNEDGTLNEGELRAAAGALIDMRPRLAKPEGPRWQNFGQYTAAPPTRGSDWTAVINPLQG